MLQHGKAPTGIIGWAPNAGIGPVRSRPTTPTAKMVADASFRGSAKGRGRAAKQGRKLRHLEAASDACYTSSHGVLAISAARIVGDHSISRPAASCSFQRSTTPSASARAARSAACRLALILMPGPDPHGGIIRSGVRQAKLNAPARQLLADASSRQIEIWRPISTTWSPGRLKKSVKWAALRSMKANNASCQRGKPFPSWRFVTVSCPTK
jgi:hypothetical protein